MRVNRSGFDFTCPGCGIQVGTEDFVCTLPVSQLVRWPVCWDCGVFWVENRKQFPQ